MIIPGIMASSPIPKYIVNPVDPVDPVDPNACFCEDYCDNTWYEPAFDSAMWDPVNEMWVEDPAKTRYLTVRSIRSGPNANWSLTPSFRPTKLFIRLNSGDPVPGGNFAWNGSIQVMTTNAYLMSGNAVWIFEGWNQDKTFEINLYWGQGNPGTPGYGNHWPTDIVGFFDYIDIATGSFSYNAINPYIKCIRFE